MNIVLATTQAQIVDAFLIRTAVFVVEQQVPAIEEIDLLDRTAPFLVAYANDGTPTGTARILLPDENTAKIGRVAVLPAWRHQGLGRRLMEAAETFIREQTSASSIRLGSQISALPFYEKLGYVPFGDPFVEAGIDHVMMQKSVRRQS
jgi:predicted GNAT family N-acyltransferase